jgi:hypothetical protein
MIGFALSYATGGPNFTQDLAGFAIRVPGGISDREALTVYSRIRDSGSNDPIGWGFQG